MQICDTFGLSFLHTLALIIFPTGNACVPADESPPCTKNGLLVWLHWWLYQLFFTPFITYKHVPRYLWVWRPNPNPYNPWTPLPAPLFWDMYASQVTALSVRQSHLASQISRVSQISQRRPKRDTIETQERHKKHKNHTRETQERHKRQERQKRNTRDTQERQKRDARETQEIQKRDTRDTQKRHKRDIRKT